MKLKKRRMQKPVKIYFLSNILLTKANKIFIMNEFIYFVDVKD